MAASTSPKRITVDDVKSKLLRPALTSHYHVDITPPDTGFLEARLNNALDSNRTYDRITIGCTEASLPGSSLATTDIDNDYHGVSEKHAYRRIYDDRIDFTFFVDAEEYYVIRYFEAWIAYTVNEQRQNFDNPYYSYRVNYPRANKSGRGGYYAPHLSITKFERDYDNSASLKYTFINAFPISIGSMPVSYDQSNLLKCTVSFSYSRYRVDEGYNRGESTSLSEPQFGSFSNPTSPLSQAAKSVLDREENPITINDFPLAR